MQDLMKKYGWHGLAVGLFFVLVIVYFAPSILDGKVMRQGDSIKFVGMVQELTDYYEQEGETSEWLGSMFGGMPAYNVGMPGKPQLPIYHITQSFKWLDYMGGSIVLAALIAFYILMCVMGVNRWLAIAGAIAYAFASYNLIILQAGHISKAYTIAYMPLTIAGMCLLFKRKIIWGALLFIFGISLSIMEDHVQITYYLALFCFFIYLGYAYKEIKEKNLKSLAQITGIMVVSVLLAVAPNYARLYSNLEMSQTSTRGPSELTQVTTGTVDNRGDGLDKEYAFQWSYGKGELLTFLIPRIYGGSSNESMDSSSGFYQALRSSGYQVGKEIAAPTYWGDKPFTSGPVYFGAVVCFLFVLGMFVIRNPMKWWMFAGGVFLTLLSLGRNLDGFNDFMFHHLPMYNKFRTVEMALVIPGLLFPLIAFWGVKEIVEEKVEPALLKKGLITSLAITGGLCLLVWLFPTALCSFQSAYDAQFSSQPWYNALLRDRASIASSDALRSLMFILLTGGLLFLFIKAKNKQKAALVLCAGVTALVLVDLWGVDKRYLNDKNFVNEKMESNFLKTPADMEILKDTDPSFRVATLSDPFQNSFISYYHRSIGGYHAAKLGRYQELIDYRLSREIQMVSQALQKAETIADIYPTLASCPGLNMLDTRYIIYNPEYPPIRNPFSFGNAWFVSSVEIVENADEELATLNTLNPLEKAIVDKRFADILQGFVTLEDSTATIKLNSYSPNKLEYTSHSTTEQLAVFSEIYYQPGWKAYIDGKPVPHFRADWILRAMRIPAGEHQIVFEFEPDGYIQAARISTYSAYLILLLLLAGIGYSIWGIYKKG